MNHLKPIALTVILIVFLSACGGDQTARDLTSAIPAEVELHIATPVQTAIFTDLYLETVPGDATPDPLLDLPYTEENPLTDPEEILQILDELQSRELTWFSCEGGCSSPVCGQGQEIIQERFISGRISPLLSGIV